MIDSRVLTLPHGSTSDGPTSDGPMSDGPTPDRPTLECITDPGAAPDAAVLVYHHGTPAAGPLDETIVAAARAAGFAVVELVRPGYGRSTRQPGRHVVDVVPLVAALADTFGVERFVTMGWSGGGPHALATGAGLPDRCAAVLSLASVAPYDAPGLDFLAGMGEENIIEFGAALQGPRSLEEYFARVTPELAQVTGADVIGALASLLPAADRAYLTGASAETMAAQLRWSLEHGWWGWFDDDVAFTRPWGFDLDAIRVPVLAWQGSDDLMVPASHGEWLGRQLPAGAMTMMPGEGHLSIASALGDALRQVRSLLP